MASLPTVCAARAPRALAAVALIVCALLAPWSSASAQTSCNATNRYTLDWDALTPKNTALGTGSRNFTITNAAGSSVVVTMTFPGDTARYIDSGYGQTPNISVQNVGGIAAGEYTLFLATDFLNYTNTLNLGTNVAAVRFSFSVPVREVGFRVLDIDFASGQFRDWVQIGGQRGATAYIPVIVTPQGRSNTGTPGFLAPGVSAVGPTTVSGAAIANGQISGVGASSLTQDNGRVTATFATPVDYVEVRYANGPTSTMTGTAGIQSISIHDLTFCPMPNIVIDKTSAPVATSGDNRFTIPGSDVDYTITVTNSGGSTVDATTIVLTDLLPANVTFNNVDLDAGTAGVQPYVFTAGTSGVALAAANVAYTNNNGSTYAYTPAAGIDPAVDGVRYSPTGTMAANSSFSVRFRTRVN